MDIVHVDDDLYFLERVEKKLKQCGFKIAPFDMPAFALNYIRNNPTKIDIVLLDIEMPGISGIELYFKIKNSNPDLEILFLTDHSNIIKGRTDLYPFETLHKRDIEYLIEIIKRASYPMVLIIDDDNFFLQHIKNKLSEHTVNIFTKDNCQEAVDMIISRPLNKIFIDINMPAQNGIEVAKKLIEIKPDLDINFISAFNPDKLSKLYPHIAYDVSMSIEEVIKSAGWNNNVKFFEKGPELMHIISDC